MSFFCNYRKTVKMTFPSLTHSLSASHSSLSVPSTSCCSQYSHAELLRKVFEISQLAQTRPKQSTQAQLDWKFRYTVTYTHTHAQWERHKVLCTLSGLRFVNGGKKQQAGYMAQFLIVNLRDRNTYIYICIYAYEYIEIYMYIWIFIFKGKYL